MRVFRVGAGCSLCSECPLFISLVFIIQPNICLKKQMKNQDRDVPLTNTKPIVQVYAIMNGQHEYEDVGTGTLEIITDADESETQHYIEVADLQTNELILRSRLQIRNNFQRQKNSIICWEDIEQFITEELALSFEHSDQCDIYWKYICQKIGKNYLQINGSETLSIPTETNIDYIYDKAKTSYNLIAFHIINSEKFMAALRQVFVSFRKNQNQNGIFTLIKTLKQILSHIDHKVIHVLLMKPNFEFILSLYQQSTHIHYTQAYQQSIKVKKFINLSLQVEQSIDKYHNYIFFRDFVLDLSKDRSLEQMLSIEIRQTEVAILKDLLQHKIFQQLVETHEREGSSICSDLIKFIFQLMGMLKQAQSDSLKRKYISSFYESGLLRTLQKILEDENKFQILQIFDYLSQNRPEEFLHYLRESYREYPTSNILLTLSKKFSSSIAPHMVSSIFNFLKTLWSELLEKQQNLSFFVDALVIQMFKHCTDELKLLQIVYLILEKTDKIQGLADLISETRIFHTLQLNPKTNKKVTLEVFKIVKLILKKNIKNENTQEDLKELNSLNDEIIKSGVFQFCVTYLQKNVRRNCLLTSIMLGNLSLLTEMQYNVFIQTIKKYQLQGENHSLLNKYLSKIKDKENPYNFLQESGAEQGRKRKHILPSNEEEKGTQEEKGVNGNNESEIEGKNRQQLLKMQEQLKKQRNEETSPAQEMKKISSGDEQKLEFEFPMEEDDSL